MIELSISRVADGMVVAGRTRLATRPLDRARGLLGRPPLAPGEGLLIRPCGSIHTFGMGYALDVVFMGADRLVRKVVESVRPWRMAGCLGAAMTLELPAGTVAQLRLCAGDQLVWQE